MIPRERLKAHEQLDRVVLAAYALKLNAMDAEVLSALFTRYEELAAPFGIGMVGESKRRSPVKRNGK